MSKTTNRSRRLHLSLCLTTKMVIFERVASVSEWNENRFRSKDRVITEEQHRLMYVLKIKQIQVN